VPILCLNVRGRPTGAMHRVASGQRQSLAISRTNVLAKMGYFTSGGKDLGAK